MKSIEAIDRSRDAVEADAFQTDFADVLGGLNGVSEASWCGGRCDLMKRNEGVWGVQCEGGGSLRR